MLGSFDAAWNTACNGTTFVGVFQILMECDSIFVHYDKFLQDLRQICLAKFYRLIPLWWIRQQMTVEETTEIRILDKNASG